MKKNKIILAVLILSVIALVFTGCGGGNPVVPPIDNGDDDNGDDEEELKFWDGEFSTYQWVRKDGLQCPGPNDYSNSIDNVWKDDQGYLHLRITKRDNKWYCAEIYSEKEGWGYGKYEFELGPVKMRKKDANGNISEVNYLDKKVVFGLFTYDSSIFAHKSRSEIDIEFAQWNRENNKNGNYTVWYASEQPQEVDKNNTFPFPIDIGRDTFHSFEWNYDKIVFSSNGSEKSYPSDDFIYQENYSSIDWGAGKDYIPISNEEYKEKVHINLYWFQEPPTEEIDIEEIEVIIKSFQFTAIVTEPPSVSVSNKIFLESGGNLNGTSINPSNPVLTVNTGESITGILNVQATYSGTPGNVVPFGYTPSWGSHSSSYVTVKSDLPVGTSTYNVSIDLNAPPTSGTYFLIFATNAEMNLGWTMSQTNWTTGTMSWNDGNDIADLTE